MNQNNDLSGSSASIAQDTTHTAAQGSSWKWGWKQLLTIVLLLDVAIMGSLLITKFYLLKDTPVIATVDLIEIVEDQQMLLASEFLGKASTDSADAQAKMARGVEAFTQTLEDQVNQLRAECRCVLLTKAAVIGPSPMDLTASLREKLKMPAVNREELQTKLKKAFEVKLPEPVSKRLGGEERGAQ